MKKSTRLITIAMGIIASLPTLSAQSGLSNLSFESWTSTVLGPTPTGWMANNCSQETTGAQSGNKYARLKTASNNSGFLFLGNSMEGAPIAGTPISINGFYKTSGMAAGDTMRINAITYKATTVQGVSTFIIKNNQAAWTSFSAPFAILGTQQADTIEIYITNDPGNASTAVFDIDNITFNPSVATNIDTNATGTSFMVYPNPAQDQLTIISKEEHAHAVIITDLVGKEISRNAITEETTHIQLSEYHGGIYFYTIIDEQEAIVLRSKFVVEK